ncbi:hypothetical protein DFJ73DRAFT_344027 [Zopfochytrium polystomum]|nr:hypothetical protein DFJ73DRAFT_344027 [Zopfochytrium polystomum]
MRKTMASLLTLAAVILTTSSISICKPILTQNPAVGSSESTPRWIYIVSIILVATFIFLMGFYFCFCVVPILWRTACHANASSPARAASASEPARAHSRGRTVHFAPSAKNSPGALSTGAINTRPVITTSVMQHSPTSPAFYTPLSPIRGIHCPPSSRHSKFAKQKSVTTPRLDDISYCTHHQSGQLLQQRKFVM